MQKLFISNKYRVMFSPSSEDHYLAHIEEPEDSQKPSRPTFTFHNRYLAKRRLQRQIQRFREQNA